MKYTYIEPELEVLELSTENRLLLTLSGGVGTGSDMLAPDTSQDPFGILNL
jgi:hypothetical protein